MTISMLVCFGGGVRPRTIIDIEAGLVHTPFLQGEHVYGGDKRQGEVCLGVFGLAARWEMKKFLGFQFEAGF